jgi:phytoene dehydrogenase-like protein
VVIGAGHNGLVAATMLADVGWDVLVLEAADSPGGAIRTAEVAAPGYASDLASAFYPLAAASPVLRRLGLEDHGLRWVHAPQVLAHVLPDDRAAVLSRDPDRTAASVDAFAPGDGKSWLLEAERAAELLPPLVDALFQPFPPVRGAARLAAVLGIADGLRFARFAVQPVRRFVAERFAGEGARLLFAGNALHTDLGPESAGGAIFGWLLAMLGQHVGFPVPQGGAGRLIDALVGRLRAAGGQLECGRRVERVVVARGRAIGVRCADGTAVRARRAVLAEVPAPHLYRELVGEGLLPSRLGADLDRFQWDDATMKVDWAVSGRVPWSAEGVGDAGTVHLGVDLDGLTRYAADLACGRLPEHPFLLVGQMTTADPLRSPAGTESLWAYTHVPRGTDPAAVPTQVGRMEAVLERHAPGFRDLVVGRYVQGPADLQRADPALDQGSLNMGTAALHQELIFRPVPGLGRADTPIDRLYLAGASAHPGGGVHGGPGANAARAALLRDRRLTGSAYGAAVRVAHRRIYAP